MSARRPPRAAALPSRCLLALSLVLVTAAGAFAGQTFTYTDLVKRLTNLEALAVLPVPGEKCQQWSSYDRASKYDEKTGKYVAWDANGDGGGIIRQEGNLSVMAEMEGPGVIWRTWSAAPENGRVIVYLDGATEPAIDLPFRKWFDGSEAPFQGSALCHDAASGKNCYVPIPFQKSCKIVAEKGWGAYFQFTYTTYPKDTVVPTFRRDLAPDETAALAAANQALQNRRGHDPAGRRAGERTQGFKLGIKPGETVRLPDIIGPRAITALRAKLDLPAADIGVDTLRELCLRIRWDDEAKPSVWVPLGDFFGTAPGVNQYRSLPLGMTDRYWYSFWYMPFAKRAHIEITNDGKATRKLTFRVTHAPLDQPLSELARFHAKWHRDAFLPEEPERHAIDWTILKTRGRGRFVGVVLHVWNPMGGWWGEGDEKFFVDGEKFPSTIGTGSEDYFGYAWCNPTLFQNAYHDQTHNDGNNRGHVSVNRWHIVDNVPFQGQFEADIEKYYPNKRPTLYAATAYFYLAAGQDDGYPELPLSERTNWYAMPPRTPGVLEGEDMRVLECTGGGTEVQGLESFGAGWSSGAHLWWTRGKPGDKLTLALPVKQAGQYKMIAQFTKAIDYGIVQLYLDGQKLGDPIDFFNNGVIPTGALDLGVHKLAAGDHKLTLEITGANPAAVKAYMAGVDYVKFVKAQ
jgi:hypothetical protein